jgi:hypothetical protein
MDSGKCCLSLLQLSLHEAVYGISMFKTSSLHTPAGFRALELLAVALSLPAHALIQSEAFIPLYLTVGYSSAAVCFPTISPIWVCQQE